MEIEIERFDLSTNGKELDEIKHGDSIFIPESDYGFGYIFKLNSSYEFWLIPTYGGEAYLNKTFNVNNDGARECVKHIQSIC